MYGGFWLKVDKNSRRKIIREKLLRFFGRSYIEFEDALEFVEFPFFSSSIFAIFVHRFKDERCFATVKVASLMYFLKMKEIKSKRAASREMLYT